MRFIVFMLVVSFWASPCFAQDPQARIILRPMVDISDQWYLASWVIGNVRTETPNNINVFGGAGFRGQRWWFESMIQRQWSDIGRNWMLDFRYQKQFAQHGTLYLEAAPFLTRLALYHFVIYEHPALFGFNLGVETENVSKSGLDSLGAGPRVSRGLVSIGGFNTSVATSYQIRRREPDAMRIYLVLSRRFGL